MDSVNPIAPMGAPVGGLRAAAHRAPAFPSQAAAGQEPRR